jgi:hypothetical protein
MELDREFKITVYRDINKATYKATYKTEHDSWGSLVEEYLEEIIAELEEMDLQVKPTGINA